VRNHGAFHCQGGGDRSGVSANAGSSLTNDLEWAVRVVEPDLASTQQKGSKSSPAGTEPYASAS